MLVVPGPWEAAPASLEGEPRFLLVDRGPLFLAALAELIRAISPRAVIDITNDSERALGLALQRPMDALFCEARARPISGAELATRIRAAGLPTRVVLIGEPEDQQWLLSRLGCGAVGFFTKDAAGDVFLEGIKAILAGHFVLGRELLSQTLERLEGEPETDPEGQLVQLSMAERHILELIGQAQSTRAIAASRGISEKTVRNHLANIYRKLSLRNRSEAIVWSARAGLISVPTEA